MEPVPSAVIERALQTLLGSEALEFLQEDFEACQDHLRRAFRLRAFETHPDRAQALGVTAREATERFRAVSQAFEVLKELARDPGSLIKLKSLAAKPSAPPSRPFVAAPQHDHFYRGPAPDRHLRVAELLYFTGRVSWRTMIDAIAWQRKQRPAIGELAVAWGLLTRSDLAHILAERSRERCLEPIGEFACRHGWLSRTDLSRLVARQRKLQRPIGEYFVQRGAITPLALMDALRRQRNAPRAH